ncbi:MAG: methylenetetrahydrofolate reductase [NAD(P)H] [Rikenellaceae bacterium]
MKVTEIINEAVEQGRTRFTFELLPPLKGAGLGRIFEAIDPLMEFDPAYINITYHREDIVSRELADGSMEWHVARHRPGTVGVSAAIQSRYGVPAVPHLICGGLSKYDTEDALIDMEFLGINNVLALQGDKSKNERIFMPHQHGHSHAVGLVKQIEAMNRGEYLDAEISGEAHCSDFSIGVAGYPERHYAAKSDESDIKNLKAKVDAGAGYVVTQMFYDNSRYFEFVKRCREAGINVPIIPGIKPLSTYKQLSILPEIFSITMPEALVKEVESVKDDAKAVREVGIEWAIAQGRELMAAGVPVLHLYTMSKTTNIQQIARSLF